MNWDLVSHLLGAVLVICASGFTTILVVHLDDHLMENPEPSDWLEIVDANCQGFVIVAFWGYLAFSCCALACGICSG